MTQQVILCILDGWGISENRAGNAPLLADTPTFDALMQDCPHATLITHGPDVGLPKGQMGNSEVGHTNIGAGRVVAMDLGQIDLAIEDGSFAQNAALMAFCSDVAKAGGRAHIMGVLSDGGVHGHISHFLATVNILHNAGVKTALHIITDGRDVGPQTALDYLDIFERQLPETAVIATATGRYYALDRDNRWERVETTYNAMMHGTGVQATTARAAIEAGYEAGVLDEFTPATVIGDYAGMEAGDGLFCLNFRSDRAREIMAALGDPDFSEFDVQQRRSLSSLLGMVSYSDRHDTYLQTAFPKRDLKNTLGEWMAAQGKSQFRLAETEKYPHVTFFMNGGQEVANKNEDRFMPKSPKVATYDLQPEMSAQQVTEQFTQAIHAGYDLIITNYANPDMVGHTGDLQAAMAACTAVDTGLSAVCAAARRQGAAMIVTADHGNCEVMIDPETGGPHTAHTTNLVPIILMCGPNGAQLKDGRLADVAPTLLDLMGLPQPPEMTGKTLIKRV